MQIPSNSEAVVGGQVELKCRAFDQTDIEWQHIAVGDTNSKIISRNNVITGEACRTRCSVEGSQTGELNLIITGVTLNDAGKYICMDTGTSQSVNAELVVFGKYFTVYSVREIYTVNLVPVILHHFIDIKYDINYINYMLHNKDDYINNV